jgi:glutamate N-acetyltransferase/amino-acid N-acetyltransferase
VFTLNAAAAAPVMWCREHLGAPVRAVVVNSGNANACTGPAGPKAVTATAQAAAAAAGCDPHEVLVASTGPIGIELPVGAIETALPTALGATSDEVGAFAEAITTTDTVIKTSSRAAGAATVVGVAKGAAMIAPNMATMLAFLATDAAADTGLLHATLAPAVGRTFNRISIDACESTNDSVFLFATGTAGRAHPDDLAKAVEAVCADLAEQIVRDAEGAGKFVRIRITGAPSEERAAAAGRTVAASALWRAAVGGEDPNWGRVLSALGAADRSLDVARISLSIGGVPLFVDGDPTGALSEAAATMSADEIIVDCSIGSGPGTAEVLSADLTEEYVKLNAEGTS